MQISCLVNNYNYRRFVSEAVDSALRQTRAFDEIIIVDDGSTDGSVEHLRRSYGGVERIRIVAKRNEGQLSCFNESFLLSTGDVIFFLDADDVFADDYVERAMYVYEQSPSHDCVISAYRTFGKLDGQIHPDTRDRDLGYTVLSTLFRNTWNGNPTSCLSFRREVLSQILPVSKLADWRIRADDCLVLGSSVAGGRKFQLGAPLVNYRVHDNNRFFGRETDQAVQFRYELARNRLVEHYVNRLEYNADKLIESAFLEFAAFEGEISYTRFRHYAGIVRKSKLPRRRRLQIIKQMWRHYRAQSGRGRSVFPRISALESVAAARPAPHSPGGASKAAA